MVKYVLSDIKSNIAGKLFMAGEIKKIGDEDRWLRLSDVKAALFLGAVKLFSNPTEARTYYNLRKVRLPLVSIFKHADIICNNLNLPYSQLDVNKAIEAKEFADIKVDRRLAYSAITDWFFAIKLNVISPDNVPAVASSSASYQYASKLYKELEGGAVKDPVLKSTPLAEIFPQDPEVLTEKILLDSPVPNNPVTPETKDVLETPLAESQEETNEITSQVEAPTESPTETDVETNEVATPVEAPTESPTETDKETTPSTLSKSTSPAKSGRKTATETTKK